jgi:hypothetical protein
MVTARALRGPVPAPLALVALSGVAPGSRVHVEAGGGPGGFFVLLQKQGCMWLLAALTDELVTVVVGFALTTVVGGVLGAWFQQRSWDHQNERTLNEADRGHATQICRELSQLMDKRLYRMRQLNWALIAEPLDESRVEASMKDYRTVLYEWNDTLNRNLAAAEIQFGRGLREQLERDIYEGFRLAGVRLEASYTRLRGPRRSDTTARSRESLERSLDQLRERIYELGVTMLQRIRDGRVGRHAAR